MPPCHHATLSPFTRYRNNVYIKVPHINQEKGLFLRGGPHYLCGKTEEDSVISHQHLVIEYSVFCTIQLTYM